MRPKAAGRTCRRGPPAAPACELSTAGRPIDPTPRPDPGAAAAPPTPPRHSTLLCTGCSAPGSKHSNAYGNCVRIHWHHPRTFHPFTKPFPIFPGYVDVSSTLRQHLGQTGSEYLHVADVVYCLSQKGRLVQLVLVRNQLPEFLEPGRPGSQSADLYRVIKQ